VPTREPGNGLVLGYLFGCQQDARIGKMDVGDMQVVGKQVIIVGVVAKPALNGQSGRVEAYACSKLRG
jgi:hypothetical protein